MFLLGKHPEAMARLETELDAAGLLVTEQRPAPRAFTYADISKLPWLDACVKARALSTRVSHITLVEYGAAGDAAAPNAAAFAGLCVRAHQSLGYTVLLIVS